MLSSKGLYDRAFGPVFVSLLLFFALFVNTVPFIGATDLPTLTGGTTQASLVFETSGTNKTQSLTIPKQAQVTSATLDIEGEGFGSTTPAPTDHDFNDTTNNKAWWGQSNIQAQGIPSNYEGNAFVVGDYPNIAKSDDVYKDTTNIPNMYAYHHFQFFVPATTINSISFVWEGGGVATGMIGNGGAYVYFYNNQTSKWEEVGNFACGDVWCERTITNTLVGDLDHYLDEKENAHVLAVTRSAGISNRITTDFVKITVYGIAVTFPTNPSLDVGDDADNDWTYSGLLTTKVTFSGTAFVDELNERIGLAGLGPGNATVALSFTTASAGILSISNLLVQYTPYTDNPPELLQQIPSNWSLKEDTDALSLIDLKTYFHDDHDSTQTFTIDNKSAPKELDATIGNSGKMSFTTPTENWWGLASFIVKATDSKGHSTLSNRFNVTVESVNDPPVLEPIGPKTVNEGETLRFFIKATDVDMALSPNEHIRYSSDSNLVVANAITGEVTLVNASLPTGIGSVIPVNFSATDSMGLPDVELVNVSVKNVEFTPVLKYVGNKTIREDERFTYLLKATDRDPEDSLAFSSEGALFNLSADGKIDFVPLQKDVGNHTMVLKVTDGKNWTTETVVFKVLNVNDAPVLSPMPDQTADNRHAFVYKVPVKDEDIGFDSQEKLTFSSDCNMFTINPSTGEIRFTPTVTMAGTHKCTIEVSDAHGLTASGTLNITVKVVNSPPKIDAIVMSAKAPVKAGSKLVLTVQASDQDNDNLTYQWFKGKDLNTPVGTNKTLYIKAPKSGKETYTVIVWDGIAKTNSTLTVPVKKEAKGLLPGFEMIPTVCALALVTAVMVMRRRTR